jgi:hypothetical protein
MSPHTPRKEKPLFYRNDDEGTRELINKMIQSGLFVDRPTQFHVKHRALNYYPTRGVISIDGEGGCPERGPEAFFALVEKRYPRRGRPSGRTPAPQSPPPTSPPLCDIGLVDEDEHIDGSDNERCNDADELPW